MSREWSIRRRLTRRVLTLVALAWLGTIVLATLFLDHEVNEMMDEELQALVETTARYLDATSGGAIPQSVGVTTRNRERVLRILRADDAEPQGPWPPLHNDGFSNTAGWRVLRLTAENAVIEVGQNRAWRREEMAEAASAFFVLMLPMIGLLLFGLNITLRQALSPLERLAAAIRLRGPADLSPVTEADLPTEVQPLVTGLNGYIGRIKELRQAERQFVANAAHELRTPVAAIRARLDLSADPDAAATLPVLDTLTRRVERLLQLSRSEAGLGKEAGPADLVQVLRLLIREMSPERSGAIRFDDGDLEYLPVPADPDAVAILLRNLLENALEHGTGTVQVTLRPDLLRIDNPTAGEDFLEAPFRKRPGSGGSGLGYSIINTLAAAMEVRIDKRIENGVASVTLHFPPEGRTRPDATPSGGPRSVQ